MIKTCNACCTSKPTSEFFANRVSFEAICKVCKTAKARQRKFAIKDGTHVDKTSAEVRSEDFKSRSAAVHGCTYSYEKVAYVNSSVKVEIFCTKHNGYFWQSPSDHLNGNGCKACGIAKRSLSRRLSQDEFIERSKASNSQVYDYSRVAYVNNTVNVEIGCQAHGYFTMSPANHLKGRGCQVCSREELGRRVTLSNDEFIARANDAHGGLYEYSKAHYTSTHAAVIIHCKKCNIDFEQKPANHLQGAGCPCCAADKVRVAVKSRILTNEEFVRRSKERHGDLYDYSESAYTRAAGMISIFCNRHGGYFQQTANSHMAGVGCASCASTGYSTIKQGTLYILTCGDITKIGITNFSPEIRAATISKSYGGEFSVMRLWTFNSGLVPDSVETAVLRTLRKMYSRPASRFQGSSECFLNVDRLWLVREIESEISNQEALV